MKPTTLKDPQTRTIILKQRRLEVEVAEISLALFKIKIGR